MASWETNYEDKVKIVCISDTHGIAHPSDLPDGDVLIHAGDFSMTGELHEIQKGLAWFRKFPHKYKLFIGGNHDNALCEFGTSLFEEQMKPYKDCTPIIHMNGRSLKIEGLRFFGSSALPFNPVYRPGARAYMLDGTTARHWGIAPDCDILITHGPPKGVLDMGYGDPILRAYVQQVKPKLHVFGHIHYGHGLCEDGGTTFVNAALLNDKYAATEQNDPIVVEV